MYTIGTNGFHEVLIHDMDEADPPFVTLGELGCLRLDWPRAIFSFMGRYQVDLEHLRHECRERFGSTQSGLCTYCGKFIRQDLGRHVACFHLDLAQLWRCLVSWYTVWRGTPQDCIDHMHKAHSVPATVKAANLARWFPPWTVSGEQCNTILRSSVSGVAVDALLFSRIGAPLIHRYRVFSRAGTHVAFRGTYTTKLRNFLSVADAACLRARNRRRTRALASQMSPEGPVDTQSVSAQHVSSAMLSVRGNCVSCCRCGRILDSCDSISLFWSTGHPCVDGSRAAAVCCSG